MTKLPKANSFDSYGLTGHSSGRVGKVGCIVEHNLKNKQCTGKLCRTTFPPTSKKGITSSNKKLLRAPGIATRSKDATRGSWPYY